MRHFGLSLSALGALGLTFIAAPAAAGSCGYGAPSLACKPAVVAPPPVSACGYGVSASECKVGVKVIPNPAPKLDPVTISTEHPFGHLRSIRYKQSPNVTITRVHDTGQTVALSDAPSKFSGDCRPTSTQYCRAQTPVTAPRPVAMPVVAAPVAVPVATPAPRVTHVASYNQDPSKYIPRIYGSLEPVPGIAHVPTSIVDRSWVNAMAALNSGRTRPQPIASGGMVPRPAQMVAVPAPAPVMQPAPVAAHLSFVQPPVAAAVPPQGQVLGHVKTTVPGEQYWEKVSGPTMLGNTMATQVICKRQSASKEIVRPIIGQPVPMPMGCPPGMGDSRYGNELAGGPVPMMGHNTGTTRYGH